MFKINAKKKAIIKNIDSKNLTLLVKALGTPLQKGAGVYLNSKGGERTEKGDVLCTLYSENVYNLRNGKKTIQEFPVFSFIK